MYVLAAFAWLTYSLLDYSNNDYKLKNELLKAGLNACILQTIEKSESKEFGSDGNIYHLKQLELELHPDSLESFLHRRFHGNYNYSIQEVGTKSMLVLSINNEKREQITASLDRRKRLWIFQSALLFLLVGAGIYGVYYSIRSIYQLNKQQNNFLLSVTHEFKTPIASIRLMLQTMQRRTLPEEKKAELVEKAVQNTHRLEELAENMLTAMQIENDKYQYDKESFNISDMMDRIVSNFRIKGTITDSIEPDLFFTGDRFILRIAINNLVENAFKYSDYQPIDVSLKKEGNKLLVRVADQGNGVAKEDQEKIFKRFYRAQNEEVRNTKGTGLGLFIVKQVIEKHQGKVHVEPNVPKGSVFVVALGKQSISV